MRKTILAFVSVVGLLIPLVALAQSTLYVSNLGQTPTGSAAVGSDSWIAQEFFTGTNSSGYVLNSIQLLMASATGDANGFNISIYTDSGDSPQNKLGTLIGPEPVVGGVFSYAGSGLILSPSSAYDFVVTAGTPVAQGAYNWSAAGNNVATHNNGWLFGVIYYYSSDGSTWDYSRDHFFQFAIYATEVQEPSTLALAGLGLAALSFWRFRQRK